MGTQSRNNLIDIIGFNGHMIDITDRPGIPFEYFDKRAVAEFDIKPEQGFVFYEGKTFLQAQGFAIELFAFREVLRVDADVCQACDHSREWFDMLIAVVEDFYDASRLIGGEIVVMNGRSPSTRPVENDCYIAEKVPGCLTTKSFG